MQTEEEDMKVARNQGRLAAEKQKKQRMCKKKKRQITFLSGKTNVIYKGIHFSAIPVSLYLPCEILQDTPDKSHNAKSKKKRL